jgi:hypothetical protein
MLTDDQIYDLAKKMDIPLERCCFKSELADKKLKYNKSYIVNMQNELDEHGKPNEGTHYVCCQANKYPNGKISKIYFDSYGMPPPQEVEIFLGTGFVPHSKIDIQSLMNGACGYYCLAFLHFINAFEHRSKDLYTDAHDFTDLFDDLGVEKNHLKNEFTLQQFFMSPTRGRSFNLGQGFADPNTIITEDEDYKKN